MDPQPPAQTPPPPPEEPPPSGWNATAQAVAAPAAARPTSVLVAAILLIIIGALVGLFGLLFILAGSLWGSIADANFTAQFGNLPAAIGTFVVVLGVIFLGFGVLEVLTGIYVLPGRGWARIMAIVLSVLGGLFALGGALGGGSARGSVILPVIFLAAYAFVIWAVAANGRWFGER